MSASLMDRADLPPDVVRVCQETVEQLEGEILAWLADEPYYAVHVLDRFGRCAVVMVCKPGESDPEVVLTYNRSRELSLKYEEIFHGRGI